MTLTLQAGIHEESVVNYSDELAEDDCQASSSMSSLSSGFSTSDVYDDNQLYDDVNTIVLYP